MTYRLCRINLLFSKAWSALATVHPDWIKSLARWCRKSFKCESESLMAKTNWSQPFLNSTITPLTCLLSNKSSSAALLGQTRYLKLVVFGLKQHSGSVGFGLQNFNWTSIEIDVPPLANGFFAFSWLRSAQDAWSGLGTPIRRSCRALYELFNPLAIRYTRLIGSS